MIFSLGRLKTLVPKSVLVLIAFYLPFQICVLFLVDSKKPKVVLLYTQNEFIPDWAFRLGSTPLALITALKYRGDYFASLPATQENFQKSFANAELMIVGAHGEDGTIRSDDAGSVFPPDIIYRNLKHAYIGSCNFGKRRTQWQRAFPNAKLVGYDELAPMWRGATYLLFEGPIELVRL